MTAKIQSNYVNKGSLLQRSILHFHRNSDILADGNRNQIKIADIDGVTVAIKSFKIPNYMNRVIYKYFRKSKAKRSYEHAEYLLKNSIGTPKPIAYFKKHTLVGLLDSYYVSEYLRADFTLRELLEHNDHPEHEDILKQFTQFTYRLHSKGIEFLDHSGGNTLIKKVSSGNYAFLLVDLNRMKFHNKMAFKKRMKNLRRLTLNKKIIEIISNEYSRLSGESQTKVYLKISNYSKRFFLTSNRKRRIKAVLML